MPFYHDLLPLPSIIPSANENQITKQNRDQNHGQISKENGQMILRLPEITCKLEVEEPISINLPKKISLDEKKNQTDSFTEKRNIIPNNINHILAFVQRKSKSEAIVKKAIQKNTKKSSFTVKRFYCYQAHLKQKLYVHVNKSTLCTVINHLNLHSDLFTVEEQLFYNKICRILIYYYLREKGMLVILSSQRVKQTSKGDHLKAQRSLLNFMKGVDRLQ